MGGELEGYPGAGGNSWGPFICHGGGALLYKGGAWEGGPRSRAGDVGCSPTFFIFSDFF